MSEGQGFWRRLDRRIARAEMALVLGIVVVMTVLVSISVFWKILVTPESKALPVVQALFGSDAPSMNTMAHAFTHGVWVFLCVFAVRTGRAGWPRLKQVGVGVALGLVSLGLGYGLVTLLPHGLIFAQKLSLALFMWVVLLGASIAAFERRHIVLEAGRKLIPQSLQRPHAALGHFLAAGFTVFLAWVGGGYFLENLHRWTESGGETGVLDSVAVPVFAITLSFPLGFLLTAARFLGQGIGIARGHLEAVPTQEDIAAAQQAAQNSGSGPTESQAP